MSVSLRYFKKYFLLATVLGQLPVLEVDGVELGQSITIARYLARKYNLAGKDDWEMAQADMVVDCVQDTLNGWYIMHITTLFSTL